MKNRNVLYALAFCAVSTTPFIASSVMGMDQDKPPRQQGRIVDPYSQKWVEGQRESEIIKAINKGNPVPPPQPSYPPSTKKK